VARLLLKDGGGGVVTVAYDPQRAVFYMAPDADFSVPAARSAELWLIPADGKPRPLGVMDPSKPASLPIPASYRPLARPDAVLAVSIEPLGGSPTGAPTGPVIAGGGLRLI
jgi:anti-sigma-K factor RskA